MYHSVLLKTRMYHTVLLKTNSCLCTIEGTHLSLSTSEDSNYHLVLLKTQIFNSILLKTQINLSFNTLKTPMYHSVTVLLKAQIYCSVLLKTQIYFARILYTHSGKCRLNVKTNKKQKQKDLKKIKIFFRRRERGKKRKKSLCSWRCKHAFSPLRRNRKTLEFMCLLGFFRLAINRGH